MDGVHVAPDLDECNWVGARTYHCLGAAEALLWLSADDEQAAAAALAACTRALVRDQHRPLLVLRPALALAAAILIVRERVALLTSLQRICCMHGGGAAATAALTQLPQRAIAALLCLELGELGAVSDLTAFEGAPKEWTFTHWRTAADRLTVVARGQCMHAQRLRPEPRMAYVQGLLSPEECSHIIALGRDGGQLHPSRVVNHNPSTVANGAGGVQSAARSSESCRVSATHDKVVQRVVQRAAYLTGLTPGHAEAVQVVHYDQGQQYKPHYDFFNPEDERYADKVSRPQPPVALSSPWGLTPCGPVLTACGPVLPLGLTACACAPRRPTKRSPSRVTASSRSLST